MGKACFSFMFPALLGKPGAKRRKVFSSQQTILFQFWEVGRDQHFYGSNLFPSNKLHFRQFLFLQCVLGGVTYLLCLLIYNKRVILWRSGFTFYSTSPSYDCLDARRQNIHGDTMDPTDKRTLSVSLPFCPKNPPTSPHAYEGSSTAMLGAGSQFGMGNNELWGGFCLLPFIKQGEKGGKKH